MDFEIDLNQREFKLIGDSLVEMADGKKRYLNRAVKNSLRAGLGAALDVAQRQAPRLSDEEAERLSGSRHVIPGLLAATIHIVKEFSTRRRTIAGRIQTGTREMLRISASDPNYWPAAVEYGHAAPGDRGGVKVVRPIPFMRIAYDKSRIPATIAFARQFRREYGIALRQLFKRTIRALKKDG